MNNILFNLRFIDHIVLLFSREVLYRLSSPWLYFVAGIILLITWIYGFGFQQTFLTESVLVTIDPLMALDIIVIMFMGVVLGLRLAAGLAWEREHRTLEVLIVGPVVWSSVIFSKFLVEIFIMFFLINIYLVYLLVAQPLGLGVLEFSDTVGIIQIAIFALPTLSLGLIIGAWARTVRGAVVIFIVVMGIFVTFELILVFLQSRSLEQISLNELFIRTSLEMVSPVIEIFSAAGQLAILIKVLKQDMILSGFATLWAFLLTLISLFFAAALARIRGAI